MIDKLLIVVPCLNEVQHIEDVIRQIFSSELPERHLVVVADGGSSDGTLSVLARLEKAYPRLRTLHNSQRLQSAGINLAVDTFGEGFDYLLRVDAHAAYPADYVKLLAETLVTKGAQSVVVPLNSEGHAVFQKAVAFAQNSLLGSGGSPHRHTGRNRWVDHGHHALMDLSWFRRIGGYNPTFGYNEDAELDVRLIRAGGKIWLAGHVPVTYFPRTNPISLVRQYFRYGGGRAQTVQLHKTPLKVRQMVPIAIAPMVLIALQAYIGWWLAVPALVWASAAIGFGGYLALKHRSPIALLSGPAAMVMHVAWSVGYWRRSSFFTTAKPQGLVDLPTSGYAALQRAKLVGQPTVRVRKAHSLILEKSIDFSVKENESTGV